MREIVKITLGAGEHIMRPTFEAYGAIEARLGALRPLYAKVISGGATLSEMACIVATGLKQVEQSDGRKIEEEAVAKRLFEAGPWSDGVILPAAEFLACLGWTPEQKAKIEAEAERLMKGEASA